MKEKKKTLQTIWLSVTNTRNNSKNHNLPAVWVTCLWLRYHTNLNWLVFRRPWIASGCATFYCVRTEKKYHKCILLSVFNIQIEHGEQSQSEHNYDYSTYGKIPSTEKNAFNFVVRFLFSQMFMLVFFLQRILSSVERQLWILVWRVSPIQSQSSTIQMDRGHFISSEKGLTRENKAKQIQCW